MSGKSHPGEIVWRDLTVEDAEGVRDFYREVVGWKADPCNMGDYDDYNMIPEGADVPVAGICHRRGPNRSVPAQWLVYVQVADLNASLERVKALGGSIVDGPRGMGESRFCVVRDPAGAIVGLIES